jgi:hypothetical protein
MKRLLVVLLTLLAFGPLPNSRAQVSVLTYHNDNLRTGANTNETILTPATVSSNAFRRLFTRSVDGYVYAQPLVAAGVNIPKVGAKNVVYVATEHDSLYAFDADTGHSYWHAKLLPKGGKTVASITDAGCGDLIPEIGVTSTPVIDPSTSTIYVVEKGKTNTVFFQRLHALDLATGAEKFGGPVSLTAAASGSGDGGNNGTINYDPLRQHQRSGLLLVNGVVYIASAAQCDNGPYHGWILGYNATNLTQVTALNTTPNGSDGGVWMSGCGPAADASGNIYVSTGNGTFDADTGGSDYGDTTLKLSTGGGLAVADYFTPFDQDNLNNNDNDHGAGGVLVLPDQPGAHAHLAIQGGKEGTIYVMDRDNMGHFHVGDDSQIVQSLPAVLSSIFCTPAYFNGNIYCNAVGDALTEFSLTNGLLSSNFVSRSASIMGFPGATPSVSANGVTNAIVWLIQTDAFSAKNGQAILHAYNATDLTQELYNSTTSRQPPGAAVKFAVPTIANGKVYVGAVHRLAVYGLH